MNRLIRVWNGKCEAVGNCATTSVGRNSMPGLEGKRLDRYELLKLVGRGGMADVYQGYDPHMDRQIAVKVFKREDEEMLSRFIREARLMASFRNDHLVAVFDSGES